MISGALTPESQSTEMILQDESPDHACWVGKCTANYSGHFKTFCYGGFCVIRLSPSDYSNNKLITWRKKLDIMSRHQCHIYHLIHNISFYVRQLKGRKKNV